MALPNLSGLSKFIQKPAPVSVDTLFVDILGRAPDPGGKAFYEQQLASGAKTLDQIAADLQYAVDTGLENKAVNQAITQATTQAAATLPTTLDIPNSTLAVAPSDAGIASLINQVYQDELGGNADAGGLQFYTNLYKSGVPIENIRAQIDDSPEGRLFDELQQASGSRQTITEQGAASAFDLKTQDIYGTDPYIEAVRTFQEEAYRPISGPSGPGPGGGPGGGGPGGGPGGGGGDERAQYDYINQLYLNYLGRPANLEELQSYANLFGSSVDLDETRSFILGGVSSGEISQERADALLAALGFGKTDTKVTKVTKVTDATDATDDTKTTTKESEDIINRLLYQPILGRTGDPGGLEFYRREFLGEGDTSISPQERARFIQGAVEKGELSQRAADAYLGTIPGVPSFLKEGATALGIEDPNFLRTSPTPAVQPILGLTGLPTSSQNVQNLYQSYLGRTPSPQEIAIQQQIMGPVISPLKAYDFSYAAADELANAQGPRSFGGASLLVPPSDFAQPTAVAPPVAGMAEGGDVETAGSRALAPTEIGSRFDISEFVDDEGRLISGYSRPIRDQFGTILGYEERPYERDVVFGETLRGKEAGVQLSDVDQERILRDLMIMRGQTGVGPSRGGLAGIEVRGPVQRNRPLYYPFESNYAKGGLASVAQDLASKGRFGDTMVAHISPKEAGLLKAMGGAGTINPETGLPEYFSLFPKKGIKLNLGPLGNIKFGAKSSNFIQAAIANALGVPAPIYGAFRGAVTGNVMEGIQAGLTAWGMKGMTDAYGPEFMKSTQAAAPIDTVSVGSGGVQVGVDPGTVASQQVPIQGTEAEFLAARPEFGQATTEALSGMPTSGKTLGQAAAAPTSTQIAAREAVAYNPLSNPEVGGMENLGSPFEVQAVSPDNATAASQGYLGRTLPAEYQEYVPKFMLEASGPALATGTLLGTSLIAGEQARAAAASQNAAIARDQEERRKKYLEIAAKSLGRTPTYGASGGLAKLAGGGMTYMEAGGTTGPTGEPRDVTGTGDGMSDSVPASIEGVQEARLADGEFVIPADVVADIGNGSSDAGSKKLYDMMDRIRMARHGTTEQPPEIKAERLMPV